MHVSLIVPIWELVNPVRFSFRSIALSRSLEMVSKLDEIALTKVLEEPLVDCFLALDLTQKNTNGR